MNQVTLAVAGSRKTQSIVDACASGAPDVRRLVLTYTQNGQAELEGRLRQACSPGAVPEVMGWFTFLLRHCIRPYLPLKFPGQILHGLNFDGEPVGGKFAKGTARFFDADGRAYRLHLSKLAYDVSVVSNGAVVDRIAHIYDEIHIDEVQDLTGCDLHIIEQLMKAPGIDVHMVGDIRQSVFDTNPRDPNLKQFRGVKMLDWFELHRTSGLLDVHHNQETWRANQGIASFSDTLFPAELGFEPTTSKQTEITGHDGVFAITEADVAAYTKQFNPQALRESITTARTVELPFQNFGKVKGLTFDRVVIYPTKPITTFLTKGAALALKTACGLYVAVTRAKYSVAFVVPNPAATGLATWSESPCVGAACATDRHSLWIA
ncbi:UvrD-helicase domain-containing protein [Rhodococcus hoagii]|nr:UvrD-helicase domain-containing protein [Prescottella equi]NKS99574.1 UvrD-helicase domain-containing protein [Prescottella equi]